MDGGRADADAFVDESVRMNTIHRGAVKTLRCIICHRTIEPGRASLYALTCHDHAGK